MARSPVPKLDARPDTVDFRDLMYVPTLVEVTPQSDLDAFRRLKAPVLDQGKEGACTGFGLATVANVLLRARRMSPDPTPVSPHMLYDMARRYDEWPGETYDGSSARGAMKGWHRQGVCAQAYWTKEMAGDITRDVARDALRRPLGAYFRVNHRDLVAMHSAISEVGVLFASSQVHAGWTKPDKDGHIVRSPTIIGGHAFAIVGYDAYGFWIQNSWGEGWGLGGLARVGYADWLANASDTWVARLGAAADLGDIAAAAVLRADAPRAFQSNSNFALKPYVISVGDNGVLLADGDFGLTPQGLQTLIRTDMVARMKDWKVKRVLLYAHGGLTSEAEVAQRISELRNQLLDAEVYPLSFIWHSDLMSTIGDILRSALASRRTGDALSVVGDFMLDRIDDTLEPIARTLGGKRLWEEMKQNALAATLEPQGAARQAADHLAALLKAGAIDEIHLVGFSAGAVFTGPLIQHLTGPANVKVASCTLWAPALSMDLFNQYYRAALATPGKVDRFGLYTLTDPVEQDDNCQRIYNKSLLYLVSGAFEPRAHVPLLHQGEPLLGLQRDVRADASLLALLKTAGRDWVLAPQNGPASQSSSRHHGDFDNDGPTLKSTLARILGGAGAGAGKITFRNSAADHAARRRSLQAQIQA